MSYEDRDRFWNYSSSGRCCGPRELSPCEFRSARRTGKGLVPVAAGGLRRQTSLWMGGTRAARQNRLDRITLSQALAEERRSRQRARYCWPGAQSVSVDDRNDDGLA